ncbi:MAG: FtsQ-type POTRA domain-containing protein [Ruminococcaceae bacterium]|nr:FtsQ-type POTRA domain-containing protein [Oscillospiraceae bacterium]
MAKSINDYYSEKMKKLLEMQSSSTPALPPSTGSADGTGAKRPQKGGRGYYDDFRARPRTEGEKRASGTNQQRAGGSKNPLERTVIDDIREGRAPKRHRGAPVGEDKGRRTQGAAPNGQNQKKRPIAPEQTAEDKFAESAKQLEAMQTAKRARTLRKVRDMTVSIGLVVAVFVAMCIVVYRLIFVISDIRAEGSEAYSSEELVLASGVHRGDHLFSFSSREIGELMTLRCPEILEVDVERTPPGTIVFNIKEEKSAFYADFYGEYRLLSSTLRVLSSVTEADARAEGCVKLRLPDIICATAGLTPEFSSVRDDSYIYDICNSLEASALADRAGTLDLSDKYNITLTVDGKYIIKLGDSESIDTKLKIANAVLQDDMFKKDIKATIDVTDLSETSVVVDEGLKVE